MCEKLYNMWGYRGDSTQNFTFAHPTHMAVVTKGLGPCPTSCQFLGDLHMGSRMPLVNNTGETVGSNTKLREILKANKTKQNRPEGTAKSLSFLHLFQHYTI
jgi:hypothetical protein